MQLPRLFSILLPLAGTLLFLVNIAQASRLGDTCETWIQWEIVGERQIYPTEVWVYVNDNRQDRMYGSEPLSKFSISTPEDNEVAIFWPYPENISRLTFYFPAGDHGRAFGLEFTLTSEFRFQSGCNRRYKFMVDPKNRRIGATYNLHAVQH